MTSDRPLVFVHIPKTAGTAFSNYLAANVDVNSVAPAFKGDHDALPYDDPSIRLYWGHFGYRRVRARLPNATYITFLREPLSRTFSHYLSWHNPANLLPNDPWRASMTEEQIEAVEFAQRASFEEFLLSGRSHITNQIQDTHCQYLTQPKMGRSSAAFLASALTAIDDIEFLGIVEFFDESIRRFRQMLPDFGPYTVTSAMENRSAPAPSDLSSRGRDRLHELTGCDMKLYEKALARFSLG